MPTIWTLGSTNTRKQFSYIGNVNAGVTLEFAGTPQITPGFFEAILHEFTGRTIPGGFSMTKPTPGGLGQWVQEHSRELNGSVLTPRHASHIAAILVHEGLITSSLDGNAVHLHFPPT